MLHLRKEQVLCVWKYFSTTEYYLTTEYSINCLFGGYLIPWDLEHCIQGNFGNRFNMVIWQLGSQLDTNAGQIHARCLALRQSYS